MTLEELKEYKNICNRIKQLDKNIEHEEGKEIEIVKGKVVGSSPKFPYITTHMSIEMYEPRKSDESIRKKLMYEHEREKLIQQKEIIENYIESISDIQLKTIFQYTFIDKMKQKEIATELNIDRSYVSKKISEYLKHSHNSHF